MEKERKIGRKKERKKNRKNGRKKKETNKERTKERKNRRKKGRNKGSKYISWRRTHIQLLKKKYQKKPPTAFAIFISCLGKFQPSIKLIAERREDRRSFVLYRDEMLVYI